MADPELNAVNTNFHNKAANHRKPELINKLEGHDGTITGAALIPGEDGAISVSDDRTCRVWLKRDSGQYWPSVCHQLKADACALDYNAMTRRFFIGLSNGTIEEYELAEDYNQVKQRKPYAAHSDKVTDVKFSLTCEWVLSTSVDKYFQWHCSETGRRLGAHKLEAQCLCLQFDEASKTAFVGDYSGTITILKLEDTECKFVSALKGHMGSIQSLAWDVQNAMLFSGSFDESVICWDIGGQKGTAYDLNGHHDKVQALCYAPAHKSLISAANDTSMVIWDMAATRQESPKWSTSDTCMKCNKPFFWNVKQMWTDKTIGYRQHHCRRCGEAICDNCSKGRSSLPVMGFEFEVRMCDECIENITSNDKVPLALSYDAKHKVLGMDIDEQKKKLLTIGSDRVIKIWDISSVLG